MQTSHGLYKNTFDCFKQIIKNDGVLGLYRGMATPLASITPIFAVSFFVSIHKDGNIGKEVLMMNDDDTSPMILARRL